MKNTTKMLEDDPYLGSYKDAPWCSNPKAYQNIVHEDENVIVFKDRYPVTEGHLLFVPKKKLRREDITICFEYAYKWGIEGVMDYRWEAFNIGINNGEAAGQSVMWPHVHLIPRRKGDNPNPKGGVRNVIPFKGNYDDTTEGDWENEGGMALPYVDDNTPREELDQLYDDHGAVPAPCSRTALVRDRYIDDIKSGMKTERFEKVDDAAWDKVVQRMRDKEKKRRENDK